MPHTNYQRLVAPHPCVPPLVTLRQAQQRSAEITLFGIIGSEVTATRVSAILAQAEAVPRLDIRISSTGGSVTEGWAIFNMLARHPAKEKVVTIEGIAASMASVIAMVGTEIVMPSNSYLMVHNPATVIAGGEEDLRRGADLLQHMQGVVVKTYAARTRQAEAVVQALMDAETYLSADQALELGFCDRISQPIRMAASLSLSAAALLPESIAAALQPRMVEAAPIYHRINAKRMG